MFMDRRWNVSMPTIVEKSISILSDAGLGMAMFSLGGCPRPLCSCLRPALHRVAPQLILPLALVPTPRMHACARANTVNLYLPGQDCSWRCSRASSRAATPPPSPPWPSASSRALLSLLPRQPPSVSVGRSSRSPLFR